MAGSHQSAEMHVIGSPEGVSEVSNPIVLVDDMARPAADGFVADRGYLTERGRAQRSNFGFSGGALRDTFGVRRASQGAMGDEANDNVDVVGHGYLLDGQSVAVDQCCVPCGCGSDAELIHYPSWNAGRRVFCAACCLCEFERSAGETERFSTSAFQRCA